MENQNKKISNEYKTKVFHRLIDDSLIKINFSLKNEINVSILLKCGIIMEKTYGKEIQPYLEKNYRITKGEIDKS